MATTGGDEVQPDPGSTVRAGPKDPALLIAAVAVGQGVFFSVFWCAFMSLFMGWPFLRLVLGPGVFLGFFFGLAMGMIMAFTTKPATVTIPIPDPVEFPARLVGVMDKLRYRTTSLDGDTLTFRSKALIKHLAWDVVVRIGPDLATVSGPVGIVKPLKKRTEAR